eukprot:5500647-Alexandrium_andersonii.AAC.1
MYSIDRLRASGLSVSIVADDRSEQEPVAAAIFEMTQGGSAHDAAACCSRSGHHLPEGRSSDAVAAVGKLEAIPPPPAEPRCAIEGRLRAKLEEMRDARLGVVAAPAQRLSK